jgi:hypothetical protein
LLIATMDDEAYDVTCVLYALDEHRLSDRWWLIEMLFVHKLRECRSFSDGWIENIAAPQSISWAI